MNALETLSKRFSGKRVLITGGAGFLGRHVTRRVREAGAASVEVPRSAQCDLTVRKDVDEFFAACQPVCESTVITLIFTSFGAPCFSNQGGMIVKMGAQILAVYITHNTNVFFNALPLVLYPGLSIYGAHLVLYFCNIFIHVFVFHPSLSVGTS
jgi:hypothetical protein